MWSVTQSTRSGIRATNFPFSFHIKSGEQAGLGSNEPSRDTECKAMAGESNITLKRCNPQDGGKKQNPHKTIRFHLRRWKPCLSSRSHLRFPLWYGHLRGLHKGIRQFPEPPSATQVVPVASHICSAWMWSFFLLHCTSSQLRASSYSNALHQDGGPPEGLWALTGEGTAKCGSSKATSLPYSLSSSIQQLDLRWRSWWRATQLVAKVYWSAEEVWFSVISQMKAGKNVHLNWELLHNGVKKKVNKSREVETPDTTNESLQMHSS